MSYIHQSYVEHNVIEEFLARNRDNMVLCPYHQGNLLISKSSCKSRRLKAEKQALSDLMKGNIDDYIYRKGLSVCLNCREQ